MILTFLICGILNHIEPGEMLLVCVFFLFSGGGGEGELIRVFTLPACNLQCVSWVLKVEVQNVPWFSRFYKLLKFGCLCKVFNLHNSRVNVQ